MSVFGSPAPATAVAVATTAVFNCDKCVKSFATDKALRMHQRIIGCGPKRTRESKYDDLVRDTNPSFKKKIIDNDKLLNQIVLTCSQSEIDVSASAKISILRGNENLHSSKVVATIETLKEISTTMKSLLKVQLGAVKSIIETCDADETDYLKSLKGLSIADLCERKLQCLNRIEVLDFLIANTHVTELDSAYQFIIGHKSSFLDETNDGPLSPTVDSVFTTVL